MGGSTYRDMCICGFWCGFIGSDAVLSIVITW